MSQPFFLHNFLQEHSDDADLRSLISHIARAGKYVVHALQHEHLGLAGSTNVQGEEQLKLDVLADQIFCRHISESNVACVLASEEQEGEMELMGEIGKYSVAFDPLDGSSLVDCNLAIGSVFGIYQGRGFVGKTPRTMAAAGFIIYGPRTTMMLSVGDGVHEFLLNDFGEFELIKENITVGADAGIFAPGNLRAAAERKDYKDLVNSWMSDTLTLRYSGGMVPDINAIFSKSHGIFCYPSHSKYPKGKLRLLYECGPMAYLMEQSGGSAKDEKGTKILDLPIEDIHQRTTIFIGSSHAVDQALKKLKK